MESHRERMEITLSGGKPWGFSIKGGTESSRPIMVSKLERDGKGEASGLRVGDTIISVNEVTLCGIRKDAVELIRRSGDRLMLAVERTFPRNTIDTLTQVQHFPGHNSILDVQQRLLAEHRAQADNEIELRNNVQPQSTNGLRNQPAGYIFSPSGNSKLDKRQVKETLKMVISEKRDGVGSTPPDIIRDRLLEKGRRSMPSTNEQSGNTPTHAGVKHRHENKKDVERPRSWHMSKHPEMEQETLNVALSPTSKVQLVPLMRRKSREWLESEDLKSALDRNSSESLLSNSSERMLSDGDVSIQSSARLRETSYASSRDRTSIHSNPSLMEAVQALPRQRPGSVEYDSSHSSADQSMCNAPYRSSQDSLNGSFIFGKSYKMECPSSDSKNNVRLEGSSSNKLRSSGRYGEIWKLPQVHRRARSFDALAHDLPRQRNNQKENIEGVKTSGFSHSKSPSLKSEFSSLKSPNPIRLHTDMPKESSETIHCYRGKNVDVLISNFERGPPSGQVQSDEHKHSRLNDGRSPSEGKGILKRLQNQRNSSTSILNARQHDNSIKIAPLSSSKFPEQSSGSGDFGIYAADPYYQTIPSWSDEYKKNIQGMSKKVLRVTSFTRKDLELSPPYQSPVHQPKGFRYPISINEEQTTPPSSSESGNGPKRAKSTSSLLANFPKPVISVSTTSEETNFLREKQYCQSVSQIGINHTSTDKDLKSAAEGEVFENVESPIPSCLSENKDDLVQKNPHIHCDIKKKENLTAFIEIDQTKAPKRNSLSLMKQEHSPTIHNLPTQPKTPSKPPSPPPSVLIALETEVVLPSLPQTLPTQIVQAPSSVVSSTDDISEIVMTSASGATCSGELLSSTSPLPASSAYYQTSASKAKIIHLIQEKVDCGEIIDLENNETDEERNVKKIELLKRIKKKWSALQAMKELLKHEVSENEQLGKSVKQAAEKSCTPRELERFKTFVEEIDKIFNLLFSISGRLARVDNTLVTLTEDADQEERNGLLEKKRKLALQQEEANLLKQNVDKRQETVSRILSSHLTAEEYTDFEHYIRMKTNLISEQRDVDDKMKLGEEQMRELYDSLPESLQDQHPLSDHFEAFLQPQLGSAEADNIATNTQCS